MENIVYHTEGRVKIVRNVLERGHLIRLRCLLERPGIAGLDRQALLKQFITNVERVLEGLKHPGYHKVEEVVNNDGTYTLHLVPVTLDTMRAYLDNFADSEEGLADLESAITLIDSEELRFSATCQLFDLLDEIFTEEMEEDDD